VHRSQRDGGRADGDHRKTEHFVAVDAAQKDQRQPRAGK
jgi:hypothetical protein